MPSLSLSWLSTQAIFIVILTINTGHLYRYPDNQHGLSLSLSWQSTNAIFIVILSINTGHLYRHISKEENSTTTTTTMLPVLISPLPVFSTGYSIPYTSSSIYSRPDQPTSPPVDPAARYLKKATGNTIILSTSVVDPWHFGVDPDPRIHASD